MKDKELLKIHTELHEIVKRRIDNLEIEDDKNKEALQVLSDCRERDVKRIVEAEQEQKRIRNTILAFIDKKFKTPGTWTKCEDELPEEFTAVLVFLKGGGQCVCELRDKELSPRRWYLVDHDEGDEDFHDSQITHWTNLPNDPKENQ